MAAFAPCTPLASTKPSVGSTSFAAPLVARAPVKSNAPTMVVRVPLRAPVSNVQVNSIYGTIMQKAEKYMSSSVRKQYIQKLNPSGIFGVSCTEGSVKFAAEVSRVRSLNADYRQTLASPFKVGYDLYENRKNAIVNSHNCHHEESQFVDFKGITATYNVAKAEASGACVRYASPESFEETAMMRYMDIQQKATVNPTGVYNMWCNEGAAKGQAEDIRIAALNSGYRQGQKSALKLLDEKYQQKKAGYIACHGCNYEEGLVSNYPAIGASFRSKSYGY